MTTPTERILSALSDRSCDPKRNGKGWSSRCPAHDDRRPSLSISEGDDGRALIRCHAGCAADAICDAVGLQVADLMSGEPSTVSTSTQPRQYREKRQYRRQQNDKPKGKSYSTAREAEAALDAMMAKEKGQRVCQWAYHNAQGDPVAVIARYDLPTPEGEKQEKTFRPVARYGDRWIIGGMPEPRPLYRLSDLGDGDQVFITEGEKAADAARKIGLTSTTSAHGSKSPEKTDWWPLAGKDCVILPDHDDAGSEYADAVAAILAKLTPPAVVKVVNLPDLPNHGDIADWVVARADADTGELRRELETLAVEAEPIQADRSTARIERFQPFPTDALPEPIRRFVIAGAKAIGCDQSYLALPMLTALAAAIGNTRRIQLKRGWSAPAIIWTAIVGESGTQKSPAFKLVMQPIRDRQGRALKAQAEAVKQHEADLARYNVELDLWKRDAKKGDAGEPPEKPEVPQSERCIVSDTTVEALAPILLANPRGLLMSRDELAGWMGSFDKYSGGKGGADAAHWLSMHGGESIVVDRKTGNQQTIYVPQASVSVCGGIQPGVLHRALGKEHREDGLAARLLLACPPRKPKQWNEADISPEAESEIKRIVDRLYELQATVDDEGDPRPVVLGLTPDAKNLFVEYVNSHGKEQVELDGDLSAAWSKLEEYAPRFALVIHCCRWAANDAGLQSSDAVDAASMKAGIELAEWFKAETRRVYSLLSESGEDGEQRRLVEWIERKGGSVTAREVQQGHRQYGTAEDAEAALDELDKAGEGKWEPTPPAPKGGRPSRVFRLTPASTSTQPTKTRGSGGFVDVDSVDVQGMQPNDDWGEL